MSKRMVDLKVEEGKITAISGYEVGGGGELSGDDLMNVTKDSASITRTLDTDGKVKFDAKGGGGVSITKVVRDGLGIHIAAKEYHIGDEVGATDITVGAQVVSIITPPPVYAGNVKFIPIVYTTNDNTTIWIRFECIIPGTPPSTSKAYSLVYWKEA